MAGGGYSGDSLVTLEQFGKLSAHVAQKLADIAKEIRAGCVDSDPYYKSDEDFACKYCKFLSACGCGSLSDDEYRKLRTLRGGEFWEALENSLGGEGHD
ncbi:MAG: hypothetical protein GX823_06440 [Clostridiales bacterium]|nr:hypothetical protein [Clostridiales bacterium]